MTTRHARWLLAIVVLGSSHVALSDGKIVAPRDYKGSLEEQAQEAIIIFHGKWYRPEATEDLILKIRIEGGAETFAWVIPFPTPPTIAKENPKLFQELFAYVEARRMSKLKGGGFDNGLPAAAEKKPGVEVISRRVVGSFDTAVIREKVAGALNQWLVKEGFQTLTDAEDVIGFYRRKGYVFACIKVSDAALESDKPVDSHPLRFTFKTGGYDGIYYPMRMTGLQDRAFDVNLYVFYAKWLNGDLNEYGYERRGFSRRHRDWDTTRCTPNAGKRWSQPERDPFLRDHASKIPTVAALLRTLHPGERYYLTSIRARRVEPAVVRQWPGDLWLFPYYTDRKFVPRDAREGGIAAGEHVGRTHRSAK